MLRHGDDLIYDSHFLYHLKHAVPVQIYDGTQHVDIGLIVRFNAYFVEMADTLYKRDKFTFVSRPAY